MANGRETVFISYRRGISGFEAKLVFENLFKSGFDVFFDVKSLDSGKFEAEILNQIAARDHFLVILQPGSVERCSTEGDWLRREIEQAIDLERNIVPLLLLGFRFENFGCHLTGKLGQLPHYNAVRVPVELEYFDFAMNRLKKNFLHKKPEELAQQPTEELHSYNYSLSVRDTSGIAWDSRLLPPDCIPLLMGKSEAIRNAAMVVRGSREDWRLEDEYTVLDCYWQHCLEMAPEAHNRLARLAKHLLDDGSYPWPLSTLAEAGLNEKLMPLLLLSGVVIQLDNRYISIFHDRICAWVIADGLVTATDDGLMTPEELESKMKLCADHRNPRRRQEKYLRYVVMDVIWRLASPGRIDSGLTKMILLALENENHQRPSPSLITLGARIVPHIIKLLPELPRRYATPYINNIITQIADPSLRDIALSALRLGNHVQQLAAVRILENHPTARALPMLWELFRAWWCSLHVQNEDPEGEKREGEPKIGRREIEAAKDALLASASNAHDWLIVTVLDIGKSDEMLLNEVAHWIPLVQRGSDIWKQVKGHLLSSLRSHRGSIAFCIEAFDDREEIPWLLDHINIEDSEDDIGPRARRALYRLDPQRCLQPTSADLSTEYLWFHGGWLPWAQLERPVETEKYLSGLVEAHGAWEVAELFQGRGNWIPPGLFDKVLDLFSDTLAEAAESKASDSLSCFFYLIKEIYQPILLGILWSRSGSDLECRLADWLIQQGPNDEGHHRGDREIGLEVFAKMAGRELPRVAADLMERATSYLGREDAVSLGARRWDKKVVDLLWKIACRDALDDLGGGQRYPVSQQDALKALAIAWQNQAIVDGLVRVGLEAPREIPQYMGGRVLDFEVADRLAQKIGGDSARDPGSILALGLSGRKEYVSLLHRVISELSEDEAENEDTILAGLLALEALKDSSQVTIDLLVHALEVPRHGFAAWRALAALLDESPTVGEIFFSRVSCSSPDIEAATILLNSEFWRKRTAAVLWECLAEERIMAELGEYLDRFVCLDREDVRALIRKAAYDFPGASLGKNPARRAAAIRGLMLFDKPEAFKAAQSQLACGPESWRSYYPLQLLEADEPRARDLLKDLLSRAKSLPLIRATGEALEEVGHVEWLCEWMKDSSEHLRQGACLASNGLSWSQSLDDALLELCRDSVRAVQTRAAEALEALREEKWSRDLLRLLRLESDSARRWAIVEAAVELRSPGVMGSALHLWTRQLPEDLPYHLRRHVDVRFGERRKKLIESLEKETRY